MSNRMARAREGWLRATCPTAGNTARVRSHRCWGPYGISLCQWTTTHVAGSGSGLSLRADVKAFFQAGESHPAEPVMGTFVSRATKTRSLVVRGYRGRPLHCLLFPGGRARAEAATSAVGMGRQGREQRSGLLPAARLLSGSAWVLAETWMVLASALPC